jgi:hypothetical protein
MIAAQHFFLMGLNFRNMPDSNSNTFLTFAYWF